MEDHYAQIYGVEIPPCPFTSKEITELPKTSELLVYLPANASVADLCELASIDMNINYHTERMIYNVMVNEDQWFITSTSPTPELLYQEAKKARRIYEDQGLYGMDLRRYLAFVIAFKFNTGELPDQRYWTFLLAGNYDRSGVSIVGFDRHGILSHHGWMKDFKAKFAGSRYVVLPPRLEITPETEKLERAYRTP